MEYLIDKVAVDIDYLVKVTANGFAYSENSVNGLELLIKYGADITIDDNYLVS